MKRLLFDALAVAILFASATVSAKTINLYTEPKTDSKVASTLNTEAGVTIVYTPKSGEWIKVANPNNGEVGWVKSSDLGDNGYTMRVFYSGKGTHSHSTYQLGLDNSQFNHKQLENELRLFKQQQRLMQTHMAHMLNDMFYFSQPIFVPVLVTERADLQKTTSAKAAHIKKEAQIQTNKN